MDPKLKSLFQASKDGDVAAVKKLIHDEVDVNGVDSKGDQAIHYAAMNGHNAVIDILVSFGKVNIDSKGCEGLTPLHWAVSYKQLSAIEFLVSKNADCNAVENYNATPLHLVFMLFRNSHHDNDSCPLTAKLDNLVIREIFAEQCGIFKKRCALLAVAEYLIQRGSDTSIKNKDGKTPLDLIPIHCSDYFIAKTYFERLSEVKLILWPLKQMEVTIESLKQLIWKRDDKLCRLEKENTELRRMITQCNCKQNECGHKLQNLNGDCNGDAKTIIM